MLPTVGSAESSFNPNFSPGLNFVHAIAISKEALAQGARVGKDSNPTDIKRIFLCLYGLPLLLIPFIRANAIMRYL